MRCTPAMATKQTKSEDKPGVSKLQLAVGAASLFLFIVGLKRTFQVDEVKPGGAPATPARPAPVERRATGTNAMK